jgi:tetratricopeptide (TPR) repeat protein
MYKKILTMIFLSGLLFASVFAATFESLPLALQAGRAALDSSTVDSASSYQIATELTRLCDKYPSSSLIPEALLVASRLDQATRHSSEAVAIAQRVVKNYPTSEPAAEAFDLLWSQGSLTNKDITPAREMAAALGNSAAAARYYKLAFEACRSAHRWKEALVVGDQYLKNCPACPPDPAFLLAMSDMALASGDLTQSKTILDGCVSRFADTPLIVSARSRLGHVLAAQGDESGSRENLSLAWSIFQKNHKKVEFHQADVEHSAADALWTLQTDARREFESATAVNVRLDESRARKMADKLIAAYQLIMETDAEMAPQALNAIGDVHASMADALLKEGFLAAKATPDKDQSPYGGAIPEYGKAVASYSQAFERCKFAEDSNAVASFSNRAASRAFELTSDQGDAVFAWAVEVDKRAPQAGVGMKSDRSRFEYLTGKVAPLLAEGVAYKTRAITLSATMPVVREATAVRQSLDLPLRAPLAEIARTCQEQNQLVAANSAQLASSLSMGIQNVATTSLADSVADSFARAAQQAQKAQKLFDDFYQSLRQCSIPQASLAYWDSTVVTQYSNYAALCRSVQNDLNLCMGKLAVQKTDASGQLKTKLGKIQAQGGEEEFAGLVRWHNFADRFNVSNSLNDRMATRLGELDPGHYGTDLPSANRRKP